MHHAHASTLESSEQLQLALAQVSGGMETDMALAFAEEMEEMAQVQMRRSGRATTLAKMQSGIGFR